jgi:3-phenylpropionate/trans-cinnamate dioxygenase ferredoxin reductase subunit
VIFIETEEGMMSDFRYLIVGGGMAADAAVRGIRQVDQSGEIEIISNEGHPPYNRPPLSKSLWKGESLEKVWRKTPTENVEIQLSRTVRSIDTKKKCVVDDKGTMHSFEKLLLATGGRVRRLPWNMEGIIYFRTLDDYQKLRSLTERGDRFAVIGGGFIGSEIAAALAMNHKSVTVIFPEEGIGARVYPSALSRFLNSFYQSKGVEVVTGHHVSDIEKRGTKFFVRTPDGHQWEVDGVVAGIGILPNVELAQSAGLAVENGIRVDEFLRTTHPDIFAAGDAANFYNPALASRIRVEHEDNANMMGELAGKNMAGPAIPYHHLPFFYSDLFELGYEAVGELDARLETIEDWKEEFHEGVVYYIKARRVRGVLLWNTWGQVDAARKLIAEQGPFNAENLKGRLPAEERPHQR